MRISDGVRQGSILGPFPFLCYIDDLKYVKLNGFLSLYADDISITVFSTNIDELVSMDSHLSMRQHLEILYKSAMAIVFTPAKIRRFIDTRTSVIIFKSHFAGWNMGGFLV